MGSPTASLTGTHASIASSDMKLHRHADPSPPIHKSLQGVREDSRSIGSIQYFHFHCKSWPIALRRYRARILIIRNTHTDVG